MTEPATRKYKRGTTFVFFGLVLLGLGIYISVSGGNVVLALIGLVLLIVGIAQKSERSRT